MRKIAADFDRKIDLPGIGPCPRPVDIDQSVTGFKDLVSMRIYAFADGNVVNGESEHDEVLIVLLRGHATIAIDGQHKAQFKLSADGTRAIYMPPGHHYQLVPQGDADIAYVRARTEKVREPKGFTVQGGTLVIESHPQHLAARLVSVDAQRPVVVETSAGTGVERLVHFLQPARVTGQPDISVAGWETLALDKGETLGVRAAAGQSELLIVSAR